MKAAVLTSFTDDYALGHFTEPFNRAYAERHGYEYICRVQPPSDWMTDKSKRHPTWDKVELLLELLSGLLRGDGQPCGCAADTTHLLWVDADAVVLNHAISLDDLWAGVPSTVELLIGEDVTPTCLVNAGVLCVHVSEWSLRFWHDVNAAPASRKWFRSPQREQSALLKQLSVRGEGLDRLPPPFYSYLGGPQLKLFPHVAVLPRHALNTNRGDVRDRACCAERDACDRTFQCDFIFHAAGHPTIMRAHNDAGHPPGQCGKREAMLAMLALYGHSVPAEAADALLPRAARARATSATSSAAAAGKAAHLASGEGVDLDADSQRPIKRLRYPGRIMN